MSIENTSQAPTNTRAQVKMTMLIAIVEGKNKKDWNVTVKINFHNARFKIDTGA